MVAYIDGELVSLWDCEVGYPYSEVACNLAELVTNAPIENIFLHETKDIGVLENHQQLEDGSIHTWSHFHLCLPAHCVNSTTAGSVYGEKRTTMEVFRRALEEITKEAIEVTLELIDQNSIYRGEEHRPAVKLFWDAWREYDNMLPTSETEKDIFCWRQDLHPAVTHMRNSAIGSLLIDLSAGEKLDDAVRKFEAKVAPANYKRPKAVVTKSMIERAKKTVEELGYGSALGRRFATFDDISINDVLFGSRDARKVMGGDVFDELIGSVKVDAKKLKKVEEVSIDTFINSILPRATSLELLFENKHAGNLVNLVAPQDPDAKLLFKWPNNFSWAYNGDLADSIKERVKARGGNVTGAFRASLSWFNSDDLDLHLVEPYGQKIYFGSKRSSSGGVLDVDMNVFESGSSFSRNAVENITYETKQQMPRGKYLIIVHNYRHRECKDTGFEVELEFDGVVHTFVCDREVRPNERVEVAELSFDGKQLKIVKSLPISTASKVLWGLDTNTFHPVTLMMRSPNYWEKAGGVGNLHYFFMLKGCIREGSSRGFFNEYLNNELNEHRKVFELLGSKMRTEEEGEQLSGLGFSSTQNNKIMCKVSGSFTRTVQIVF
jgi:hypothetical protein